MFEHSGCFTMTPDNFKTLDLPQKKHKRSIGLLIVVGVITTVLVFACICAAILLRTSFAEALQISDETIISNVAAKVQTIQADMNTGKEGRIFLIQENVLALKRV